jgi:hypothetical protein
MQKTGPIKAALARSFIPLIWLLVSAPLVLIGCRDFGVTRPDSALEAADATGRYRLELQWVVTEANPGGHSGYDFHALVWSRKTARGWEKLTEISREEFEKGRNRRRWVSQLHSLNPSEGTAIIKVAEGDAPRDSGSVQYMYSWREWNLRTNGEVRIIRVCKDPFEEF